MWFHKQKEVICIGSASKDIFFPTDEAVLFETPEDITAKQKIAFELGGKYRVADRSEAVGGVAANVSIGLARLGHTVGCYSNVGDDEAGKWIEKKLKKEGVDTSFLSFQENTQTDLSAIVVMTQNGERTIFHNRDANEKLTIKESLFKEAKWFFVSALNGEWKKSVETILLAKLKYGFSLAVNPGQHNLKEDPACMKRLIEQADVLLLNKDEAIEFLMHEPGITREQLENEETLLEKLHAVGAKVIGMTDGKRGAWGFNGVEYWFCPIHTLTKVVDTTGAGDAFGSGFFAAYLNHSPLEKALQYGIANSGSVVGFYGTNAGLLHKSEMKKIITQITPQKLKVDAKGAFFEEKGYNKR